VKKSPVLSLLLTLAAPALSASLGTESATTLTTAGWTNGVVGSIGTWHQVQAPGSAFAIDDSSQGGRTSIGAQAFNIIPGAHTNANQGYARGPGSDPARERSTVQDMGDGHFLTVTVPVRRGSIFLGTPGQTAVIDGIIYRVLGSSDLDRWNLAVSEVSPPASEGMSTLAADYEYRTFRLDTPVSGGAKGFLRIEAGEAP